VRTKTKKKLLLIFALALLSLSAMNPSVYAKCEEEDGCVDCEGGPTRSGTTQRSQWNTGPDDWDYDDYHFIAWQKESYIYINYYYVSIDGDKYSIFDHYCKQIDCDLSESRHEVEVDAWECDVPSYKTVEVTVKLWLTDENTLRIKEEYWTESGQPRGGLPDRGWVVSDGPSQKTVTIYNDEPTGGDTFKITNFEYYITEAYYTNLSTVPYTGTIITTYTLNPDGGSQSFNLDCDLECGHVYFHYTMLNTTDHVISEQYGDHEIAPCEGVGGVMVPIDKLGLLAPYIGLASTILIATATTAIYVKRVKRRKEKQ
jgi:hypothetical protein